MARETHKLSELAGEPFAALLEIDRRARLVSGAVQRVGEGGADWIGLGFRIGEQQLVVARDEVREVLACPPLTRVPGARRWMRGLGNVRGTLLPVSDLRGLFGDGLVDLKSRDARVLALNHPDVPAGFAVDEVLGFRQFESSQKLDEDPGVNPLMQEMVTGMFNQGGQVWPVFSLYHLLESEVFHDVSARDLVA